MSRRLVIVNGLIAAVVVLLAVSLIRDLTHSRPLPVPGGARARGQGGASTEGAAPVSGSPAENLSGYNVIVAKYLFNQSRSESTSPQAAPAVPLPPKPLLMGVVVDGGHSRAYLEDPSTKRVFGYQVGDSVAGGRLEQIKGDKVTIARSDGTMDVMLHDPSKPRPEPAAARPGAPARGASAQAVTPPVARQPGAPPVPSAGSPQAALRNLQPNQQQEGIAIPGRPPIAPRMIRRLPAEPPQQGAQQ